MINQPLVSCIMPTANRQKFVTLAIKSFLEQDYPNAELIIIDDGIEPCSEFITEDPKIRYFYVKSVSVIGTKRNMACNIATGEFIVHWDDDDLYAPDWISRQVECLIATDADIIGLNKIMLYSFNSNFSFVYEDKILDLAWLCGATLAYKRSLWLRYSFADLQIGEDIDFLVNSGGKVIALDYFEGFLAGLHESNTSIKYIENINPIVKL